YCEYMPDVAKCRQWLEKNFPNEFAKLTVENSPKQEAGISEGQGTAGEEEEKKKQKRGMLETALSSGHSRLACCPQSRLRVDMRSAFGKPQGTVARVHFGHIGQVMSIHTKLQNKEYVIEALCRAKFKFTGCQKIHISKNWGFTKFNMDEFENMVAENRPIPDGCGRGQIKQKKKTVPQKVTIAKIPRAKKKYVTRVCGLATFEIDLKEAQRFFAQKFSCGASVTGEDEIIIQGDFTDDIIDVIQEKWPEVDDDSIEDLGEVKK
ncbi:hypothetical protein E2I00_018288, partial [Balaenoptera physalus]